MARIYLASPGTRCGPCESPCMHVDCQLLWYLAGKTCSLCNQAIGFERGFCADEYGLIHDDCLKDIIWARDGWRPGIEN